MTYQTKAISMTLSHLQGHSYCKPFKCDLNACHPMLVQYLLLSRVCVCRLSVRLSQVSVILRRLNVEIQKHCHKIAHRLQFYDAKDLYKFTMGSTQ